jgi:hypothetical protein
MKHIAILMMLAVLMASCATSQQTLVVSTPRENVQAVHAAGGVVGIGSGILGILSLNPIHMVKGVLDIISAASSFDKAANTQAIVDVICL